MPRRDHAADFRVAVLAFFAAICATGAGAEVAGINGPSFALTAKADRLSTPEGGSFLFWGFANGSGRAQYPGPTLIVNQGDTVTVSVTNGLPAAAGQRVSLSFPGQAGVTASCGGCVQGPIAVEAGPGGTVTYSFTAERPGTFLYNSASRPDLQVEMGLFGALIVRPGVPGQAYATAESAFDHEYLFLLSEIDSTIHDMVEQEGVAALDRSGKLANPSPNYWFINGRNAPDTMAEATEPGTGRLPTQPYNSLPRTRPGDRVLMRVIGGGRDMHPFHHHGNHARVIAVDGFLKSTQADGATAPLDLSHEVFTIQSLPGQTVDAIFSWTGRDLGWDIYGDNPVQFGDPPQTKPAQVAPLPVYAHTCTPGHDGLDTDTREYCADHGKPLPVTLPEQFSLVFGGFWPGGPFLGTGALLPPGEGGLNPNAAYTYMWHSHTEKEITNFDVFPGGMMTMLLVEPIHVPVP
jgi:FtsP/CotA-like multicopper oxidase with cupredoxin domain